MNAVFPARMALLLACLGTLLTPQHALAAAQLKIQSGANTLIVTDNAPNDANVTVGAITFSGTFAGINLIVSTVISKPTLTAAEISFTGLSNGATNGVLILSVTDTDFPGLAGGVVSITSAVGGTTNGQTTYQGYLDVANTPFGTSCTPGPQGPLTGAFDNTATVVCAPLTGNYSLSASASVIVSAGQTQSFGASVSTGCTGTIGDVLWDDQNHNGLQDPGEPGVDGVTVELRDPVTNALVSSAVTGGGPLNQVGYFQFVGLCAGTYRVSVPTPPAGKTPTIAEAGSDRTIDSNPNPFDVTLPTNNSSDQTIDFGFTTPCTGTIGDVVWNDRDLDGIQDANEPGLDGLPITLKVGNAIVATTMTGFGGSPARHGYYQFSGICAGTYSVEVATPGGMVPSSQFIDDGQPEPQARDSNGSPASVTLPTDDSSDQTIDFGFYALCTGAIGDFVWHDLDHDGIQDPGEPGIDGLKVDLIDPATGAVLHTTTTSVGPDGQPGYYLFDGLCAGAYRVVVATPSGKTATIVEAGTDRAVDSNPIPAVVTLPANDSTDRTIDFGFETPCTAMLGDFVWVDGNANGIQDLGEMGINGVTVNLRRASDNSVIATTTTALGGVPAKDGYYQFSGLCAGNYKVEVVQPAGYVASPAMQGGNTAADSNMNPALVSLATDDSSDQTIDFGFFSLAAIGNRVWKDMNDNGVQDATEPGLAGVSVALYTCAGVLAGGPVATDVNGNYSFTGLTPGSYYARFGTLVGYTRSSQFALGSDAPLFASSDTDSNASQTTGQTACVPLTSGQVNNTIDAGLVPPPPPCSAQIGNFVWYDLDLDGVQDAGEPGIAGVTVKLLNAAGTTVVATSLSDANGAYSFSSLACGDYKVEVVPPAGYVPTLVGQGGDVAKDSNASPSSASLPGGGSDASIDFGFVRAIDYCPPDAATSTEKFGTLYYAVAPNGDVNVRYEQSRSVNDNSYGANSVGWSRGHKFSDLVNSDMVCLVFKNAATATVLDICIDYISQKIGTPSGYGSLGVAGKEGTVQAGNASWVLLATSSLDYNLNTTGYCTGGSCLFSGVNLLVDSPPTTGPNSYVLPSGSPFGAWNFTNTFYAKISGAAFGGSSAGFGSVAARDLHNSPAKRLTDTFTVCPPDGTSGPTCGLAGSGFAVSRNLMKFTLANTGSSDAVLSAAQLTWPLANGQLTAIKFDSDLVYDVPDIAAPSANLTTAQLVADALKRTIHKGTSDVVTLVFEKTASTTLSQYSGKLTFSGAAVCEFTFPVSTVKAP